MSGWELAPNLSKSGSNKLSPNAHLKASATGSIRLTPRHKREPQLIVRMLLARIGKSIGKAQPFESVPRPAQQYSVSTHQRVLCGTARFDPSHTCRSAKETDAFRFLSASLSRGTEGSNPSPSTSESIANSLPHQAPTAPVLFVCDPGAFAPYLRGPDDRRCVAENQSCDSLRRLHRHRLRCESASNFEPTPIRRYATGTTWRLENPGN